MNEFLDANVSPAKGIQLNDIDRTYIRVCFKDNIQHDNENIYINGKVYIYNSDRSAIRDYRKLLKAAKKVF